MFVRIVLVFTLIFFSYDLYATGIGVDVGQFKSSDNIETLSKKISLRQVCDESSSLCEYRFSNLNASIYNESLNRREVLTSLGFVNKFQDVLIEIDVVGYQIYNKDILRNSTGLNFGIIKEENNSNFSRYGIQVSEVVFGNESFLPGSGDAYLNARDLLVFYSQRVLEDYRINYNYKNRYYSDKNKRIINDFSFLYGIEKTDPWFWFGIGIEDTQFLEQTKQYWSQKYLMSVGPRIEYSKTLGDHLKFNLGLNLNLIRESDESYNGHYISTGVLWSSSEVEFKFQFVQTNSTQSTTSWVQNALSLGLFFIF